MEWVETTGQSVELAKEAALDRLGVDRSEAEFEILEEPQTGWFGRVKAEARVRARVTPTTPRPKQERRDRGNKKGGNNRNRNNNKSRGGGNGSGGGNSGANSGGGNSGGGGNRGGKVAAAAGAAAVVGGGAAAASSSDAQVGASGDGGNRGGNDRGDRGGNDRGNRNNRNNRNNKQDGGKGRTKVHNESDMSVPDQAEVAKTFMEGLLQNMGLEGTAGIENVLEDEATVQVSGENVGLLVGPGGRTLNSLQELSRTVIQRHAGGSPAGRIRVDVGGYRARRKEALEKFVADVAAKVVDTGTSQALEPMGSADRKIVHDAANEIDGVATESQGEDPRRRVVIVPA